MKLKCFVLVAIAGLLGGCVFRPAKVVTREFILTPAHVEGVRPATPGPGLGLGAVKLPDYLLRSAVALRRGDREIEYLENARWAERLDRSFQRTLGANLQARLPGRRVQLSTWLGGQVVLAVFVQVDQFEVNAQGRGKLSAHWQIETPERGKVLRAGEGSFEKSGPEPTAAPEAIAATLSELTAQFAEKLAQEIVAASP